MISDLSRYDRSSYHDDHNRSWSRYDHTTFQSYCIVILSWYLHRDIPIGCRQRTDPNEGWNTNLVLSLFSLRYCTSRLRYHTLLQVTVKQKFSTYLFVRSIHELCVHSSLTFIILHKGKLCLIWDFGERDQFTFGFGNEFSCPQSLILSWLG
jgi:hypothetical protein